MPPNIPNATEAIAAVPDEERGEGEITVAVRKEPDDMVVIEVTDNVTQVTPCDFTPQPGSNRHYPG